MSAALMAALFYAIWNTVSAKVSIQEGFKGQFYQVPGLLTACLIYFGYRIYCCIEEGQKWNQWFIETFYVKDTIPAEKDKPAKFVYRRLNWPVINVVTVWGASDWFDNFLFILVCEYSFRAGINFSVIMSLFSCLPLIISFTFLVVFGEKITRLQLFAMLVAMFSVGLVTFSKEDIFSLGSKKST